MRRLVNRPADIYSTFDPAVDVASGTSGARGTFGGSLTVAYTNFYRSGAQSIAGAPYAWHFTVVPYRVCLPVVLRAHSPPG